MTTINSNAPLYFKMPSVEELKGHMNHFDFAALREIESKLKSAALREGVQIEGWDQEWGKYHFYDDTARLIKVLIEKKRGDLFGYFQSERTADLIATHSPLTYENLFSQGVDPELLIRGRALLLLEQLKNTWNTKYPRLRLCADEEFDPRSRAWKAKEISFLVCPNPIDPNSFTQLSHFASVVEQLVKEGDENTAKTLLDSLLGRTTFHPTSEDLSNHLRLKSLQEVALLQIHSSALNTASESLWKSIKVIPSPEDRQAKFKPLSKEDAVREAYAFECDRILGFGMTAPTKFIAFPVLHPCLSEVKSEFEFADTAAKAGRPETAKYHRQRAIDLLNDVFIPAVSRHFIFGEMYRLYGNGNEVDLLGEKLFYNYDGYWTTDLEKAIVIQNYLDSTTFAEHARTNKFEGSLQLWKNNCPRVFELIVKNPDGGALLKSAPKIAAHLYVLLGIIKGSKDCSVGNTLATIDPATNTILNFLDFDDERSMSTTRNFWELRMWQLGLPQCAQPFDRSTLLLFSDQGLLKKLKTQQSSTTISREAYQAQHDSLNRIIHLFQEELKKEVITLTPRELFFTLFGGQQEFYRIKKEFNDNKRFGQEGIRISPIELFEFHLPEMGRGGWYTSDENETTLVGRNMRILYFPDLP